MCQIVSKDWTFNFPSTVPKSNKALVVDYAKNYSKRYFKKSCWLLLLAEISISKILTNMLHINVHWN